MRAPAHIEGDFLAEAGLQTLLALLSDSGHQALIVGGAVRNALLGTEVADVDIATDALPTQVVALARGAGLGTVPTGIDHGTVTILTPYHGTWRGYEVTTFRHDVETDGRRAVVAFSGDLAADAGRRDFTMNALYARADGTVVDPLGGLPDVMARRLRFVGDPHQRIAEDYLRILRFFRFHAWYGASGEADPAALDAIGAMVDGLDRLSKERIGAEMRKLLSAPDPADALALMAKTGVLAHILPGADPADIPALMAQEATLKLAPDWLLRLAVLGADDPREMLRLSNNASETLRGLAHHTQLGTPLPRIAYQANKTDARRVGLIRLARGEALPANWQSQIAAAYQQQFPISARDLMPRLSGPALGRALQRAEDYWIDHDFRPDRATLLALALDAPAKGAGDA